MARAWIEKAHEDTLNLDEYTVVTTSSVSLVPVHQVPPSAPLEPAKTASPRSRVPYYIGYVVNTLMFFLAVSGFVYVSTDDSNSDALLGVPFGLLIATFAYACVLSEQKPSVCTCPNHRQLQDECGPSDRDLALAARQRLELER